MMQVRAAIDTDRTAFGEMWNEFVAAHPSEPGNHDMESINWNRVMDFGHALRCIIAADDTDAPVGFTLFLQLPFTWSQGDICYLLDIFVRPGSRGQGHARAMVDHLKDIGRATGWYKIFWMTTPDNQGAQRFYEKVAKRMDYLRYDVILSPP